MMRKIYFNSLLVVIICLGIFKTGFSQEYRNAIKLEPLGLFKQQYFQIGYERAMSEKITLGLMVGPTYGNLSDSIIGTGINGIGVDPNVKIYSNMAFEGFYYGIHTAIRYRVSEIYHNDGWFYPTSYIDWAGLLADGHDPDYQDGDVYKKEVLKVLFVPNVGFNKTTYSGFMFDFYFGFGYKYSNRVYKNLRTGEKFRGYNGNGIATRGNFSVGYAF